MTKVIKDDIKRLERLRDNATAYGIGFAASALSHAIKICQAVESAEGELPEKRTSTDIEPTIGTLSPINYGVNQAIDIIQPILAKALLKIQELEKENKELQKPNYHKMGKEISEMIKDPDAMKGLNLQQALRKLGYVKISGEPIEEHIQIDLEQYAKENGYVLKAECKEKDEKIEELEETIKDKNHFADDLIVTAGDFEKKFQELKEQNLINEASHKARCEATEAKLEGMEERASEEKIEKICAIFGYKEQNKTLAQALNKEIMGGEG